MTPVVGLWCRVTGHSCLPFLLGLLISDSTSGLLWLELDIAGDSSDVK